MRFSLAAAFTTAASIFASSVALNIIVSNDDGFASANVREFYRLLKASGHDVVLVASVIDQSGQAGRSQFTVNSTLLTPSEYGIIPAGAPSFGMDPTDPDVFYYNGTPQACTYIAIDYVVPTYKNWSTIDLFVGGPNFGTNLGPFLYTLSGTIGGTYGAVYRSIPGIAFSAGNNGQRSYTNVTSATPAGLPDPATVNAQLSVSLVNQLAANTPPGQRLLPLGYGLSVNYPFITSVTNDSCISPPFVATRLTGGAIADTAVFNATTKLFSYGDIVADGLNQCINGDCSLPGETLVVNGGCQSSVSVFTVDYDAPNTNTTAAVFTSLEPLVQRSNGTVLAKRSPTAALRVRAKAQRANRVGI
ncbi:hypothetical protein MMC25_006247 [Agyrium rufum]|nr:hypothetical protein [Agyrium rufum]